MDHASAQKPESEEPGRAPWVLLGILAAALGALVGPFPLAAAAVAVLLLVVGVVVRVPADSLLDGAVIAVLVLTPFERWIAGLLPGGIGSAVVVLSDALVLLLLLVLPSVLRDVLASRGRGRVLRVADAFLPLALFFVVICLSFIVNGSPLIATVYFARIYMRFVPIALGVALLCMRTGAYVRRISMVVVLSVAVQCSIGLLEFVGGPPVARLFWPGGVSVGGLAADLETLSTVGAQVVGGTLGHYNILGTYATLGLCVLLGCRQLLDPERDRRWPITLAVLFPAAIVLTLSRQSMAALTVAGATVGLLSGKASRRIVLVAAPLVVTVGLVAVLLGSPLATSLLARFQEVGSARYWRVALAENRGYAVATVLPRAMGADPLFGVGPGSFGTSLSSETPAGVARLGLNPRWAGYVPDVGYVAIAAQVGVLGLGMLLWAFGVLVRRSWRLYGSPVWRGLGVTGLGVVLTLMVTSLASSPLSYKPTSVVIWAVFGLIVGTEADAA